jgi:hypothetical protein
MILKLRSLIEFETILEAPDPDKPELKIEDCKLRDKCRK